MKEIQLTQGRAALVDDADFDWLNQFKWSLSVGDYTDYAYRMTQVNYKQSNVKMHRQILSAPKGVQVDHWNGDGLWNLRSNLRLCTPSQNQSNQKKLAFASSTYKGICWSKRLNKWIAQIQVNRKHIYLGLFREERKAAEAYDQKARELFGDFANTNF